ncbi:MAG: glycosyltransferase family 2 protein, partial [Solirubrobacteraceae bacterium]
MNINKPLVSIIVPCYNAQKYIINTLLSVKNQTYQNWECLVINDGSTDNSLQHIQEFTKKNEKFSFLSQENKGLSTTRNTGIEKSKGDYLFFLDSDDIMAENCLELLVKELSNDNWDIIVGKTSAMKNNTIQHILDHPKIKNWKINNRLDALKYAIENSLIPVAQNRLYKNCFLKETNLKFQKNLLHEDELWFFETNFYAKKICYIDNITYEYKTDNPDSIINNIKDKNVLDILKIINLIYNNYYTDSNVNKDRNIVGYYILYLIKNLINRLIEC